MIDIDPAWLVDTVTLERVIDTDNWQKPVYSDPVACQCRIDRDQVYSGTGNDREIVANATVFLYPGYTKSIPALDEMWLNGRAFFDGKPHIIKHVAVNKAPTQPATWSYELEVL